MTHLHSLIVTPPHHDSEDSYGLPTDQDFESKPEGTYRCLSVTSEKRKLADDLVEVVGVQYVNLIDVVAELVVDPEAVQPGPELPPGRLYCFRARVWTPGGGWSWCWFLGREGTASQYRPKIGKQLHWKFEEMSAEDRNAKPYRAWDLAADGGD